MAKENSLNYEADTEKNCCPLQPLSHVLRVGERETEHRGEANQTYLLEDAHHTSVTQERHIADDIQVSAKSGNYRRHLRREHLDSHHPVSGGVEGAKHLAHTAAAQRTLQFVSPE